MIQHVLMPKLGQTMEEATVARWLKKEGDPVARGDVLLEITTDKATLEVESYVSGVLRKILAREGETLPVNAVIALVGDPEDALPADLEALRTPAGVAGAPSGAAPQAAQTPATLMAEATTQPAVGKIFASPRARRLAAEEKVNLRLIRGSGPGGRIVEADVRAHLERLRQTRSTPAARALAYERGVDLTTLHAEGRITKAQVEAAAPGAAPGARRVPLSPMRRVIAERMSRSKQQIPHFQISMDVEMRAAVALRTRLNQEGPVRIAFHDMLIKACAKAFAEYPMMNAVWDGDAILYRSEIHIGLAVALEEGLTVPVVRHADRLSLQEIARESARLIERARNKRLTPDEYEGGCFTISNLGMFGVDSFVPIINPGESAILGVGRIADRVIACGDAICIRPLMNLTLSADHRALDGAIAAKFLGRVKALLESPEELLK